MRDILVLVVAACFLLSAFTSRFAGALGYWWFSVFRPQEWIWMDINSLRLTLVATVLFIIPSVLQGMIPSLRNIISFLIVTFLSLSTLANILVGCDAGGIQAAYLFNFTVALVAVLFTVRVVNTINKLFILSLLIALIISFHAGKAGLQSLLGMGGTFYGSSEMGGMFSGSNAFALGSGVLLFFVLCSYMLIKNSTTANSLYILKRFPKLTKLTAYILPLCILGIIFNVIALNSRGSALAMFGGLALWLWLSNLIRLKTLLTGSILVAGILLFAELPDGYTERLSTAFADSEELDKSAASRPHFWNIAVNMANDYPLGIGPGCYNSFYNFYDATQGQFGFSRTVHSSHFEVLAESGYIAFIIWLLMFIICTVKCWSIRNESLKKGLYRSSTIFYFHTSNMLIVAMCVYFVGGAFYALSYNPLIWLTFGIVAILENSNKKQKSHTRTDFVTRRK